MVTFYHGFLLGITKTLVSLYYTLKNKPKKVVWSPAADASFDLAEDALADATMLIFPAPRAHLQLTTNTSDIAISAVL